MNNALIEHGVAMFNALAALKLKRHQLVSTSEGVEIHQPGKPSLLLTHEAARLYSRQMNEADHD